MIELTKRSYLVIALLLAILALGGLATYFIFLSPSGYVARERSDLNRALSDSSSAFTTLDGTPMSFDAYRGQLLVVNVWASWSPFTSADHEVLAAVKAQFGDAVTILAVDRMEPKETAEAYLSTIGKRPGINYIIDGNDHFFDSFEGYAMPETIIFDRVGNIVLHTRGTLDQREVTEVLRGLSGS